MPQNRSMFGITNTIQHSTNKTSSKSTLSYFAKNLCKKGFYFLFQKSRNYWQVYSAITQNCWAQHRLKTINVCCSRCEQSSSKKSTKMWRKLQNGEHCFEHHPQITPANQWVNNRKTKNNKLPNNKSSLQKITKNNTNQILGKTPSLLITFENKEIAQGFLEKNKQ